MKKVQVSRLWKLLAGPGEGDLPEKVGQRLIEQRVEESIALLREQLRGEERLLEMLHKDRCRD